VVVGGESFLGDPGAMQPILTERLSIRPFTLEDAPFILRLLNEPSFIENITDKGVRTLEQAATYLADGPIASQAVRGHGLWLVEHRGTGAPMGMCGLIKRDSLEEVDLGYAFLPEYWGLGFATEAAEACLAHGRETLGLRGVLAIVSPRNEASIRLLDKLAFSRTGRMEVTPGESVEIYRRDLA
jgi:ribosomal-protein-alanine N-acetyltransferase